MGVTTGVTGPGAAAGPASGALWRWATTGRATGRAAEGGEMGTTGTPGRGTPPVGGVAEARCTAGEGAAEEGDEEGDAAAVGLTRGTAAGAARGAAGRPPPGVELGARPRGVRGESGALVARGGFAAPGRLGVSGRVLASGRVARRWTAGAVARGTSVTVTTGGGVDAGEGVGATGAGAEAEVGVGAGAGAGATWVVGVLVAGGVPGTSGAVDRE